MQASDISIHACMRSPAHAAALSLDSCASLAAWACFALSRSLMASIFSSKLDFAWGAASDSPFSPLGAESCTCCAPGALRCLRPVSGASAWGARRLPLGVEGSAGPAPAASLPGAGARAAAAAAPRCSQSVRWSRARTKASRQLPHVRMLNHFSVLPVSLDECMAIQPAPSLLWLPLSTSSQMRRPLGMTSPLRTPGCATSGCCSGGGSPL
mmetsp:Transcript_64444/g.203732  ORF Transcript_64444/g.203732 Transcript_64444/m.203732 type:complete len:211 (+) Transcript_64444:56-688(+)